MLCQVGERCVASAFVMGRDCHKDGGQPRDGAVITESQRLQMATNRREAAEKQRQRKERVTNSQAPQASHPHASEGLEAAAKGEVAEGGEKLPTGAFAKLEGEGASQPKASEEIGRASCRERV